MPDLSDINYQTRPTVLQNDSSDNEFATLKQKALSNLDELITHCKSAIQASKTKVEQEALDNLRKKIVEEYDKIKNLTIIIDIKQDDGSKLQYCKLNEKTGGVTEKVSLVSLSTTKARLQVLIDTDPKDYQTYVDKSDSYQIKTEAILKLPKHGKITEVQHEAIALNISRQLGFDTTKSTMVSYKNKPALFVPFEDIQLLKEFVESDKPMEKGKNKESTNYSTIKSVGESLKPDSSIEDFGKTLAFFYLCNDSDAIGGYAQNKALRNNKSLYIFDQVIMLPIFGDSLSLDSRMSLRPTNFIAENSRHLLGRNKTLIEDSSFDTKFNSVVNLLLKKDDIIAHLDTVIENHKASLLKAKSDITKIQEFIKRHEAQINEFRTERKNAKTADSDTDHNISLLEEALFEINQQLSERQEIMRDLSDLLSDAENIKKTLVNRFDKILFDALPKFDGKKLNEVVFLENQETIKQSLVLEKLLNCPRLFTEDGRPYKYPWTDKNILKVTNISLENGIIKLSFNKELDPDFLKLLKNMAGFQKPIIFDGNKEIKLEANDLFKLNETTLFPEMANNLNIDKNYLDQPGFNDLGFISQFYGEGHRGRVLDAIALYEKTVKEYDLVLISTLPENNKKKAVKGKIYLSEDGTYVVHNFDRKICAGTINTKNIDLKNLDVKIKEDEFRKNILEATSKTGHTTLSKTTEEKLEMMQYIVGLLTYYLQDAADRGFIKHVLLKLQFDIQQELQKIITKQYSNVNVNSNSNSNENLNITLIDKVNLAFNAALKLDRVAIFNEVLILAIRTNSLDDNNFLDYLDKCIEYGKADNYAATKEASEALYALQEQTRQDYLAKISSKVSTNASINIFKAESRSARSSITVPTKSSSEPIVPLSKKS